MSSPHVDKLGTMPWREKVERSSPTFIHHTSMKFISWNVNGLRACMGKGFADAFKALDADFFCLQETKMQAGQLDLSFEG